MALTVDRICAAGLALLQRDGFDALSLRRIAEALGVQPPALYWHVRDRSALYGLMAEAQLREVLADVDFGLNGAAWLCDFGRALRQSHERHRDSARLAAFVTPTKAMREELIERIVAHLVAGGWPRPQAFLAQSAIQSYTLGWSLFRENAAVTRLMAREVDLGRGFDAGLRALAEGLAPAVAVRRPARLRRPAGAR